MARTRNLKPGFFTNDQLAEIEPLGRLLFQGLWCHADREGRLLDRPKKIKAEILPYDACDVDFLLSELSKRGFIVRYGSNDKSFIQIVKFSKHQNPHVKESASEIPAPDKHGASTVLVREIPERAGPSSLNLNPSTLTLKSEIGVDEATSKVFLELGMAGNEARMLAHDSVNAYVHWKGCSFAEAAEAIVAAWNQYDKEVTRYKKSKLNFMREGLWRGGWKKPDSEFDAEMENMERERRAAAAK